MKQLFVSILLIALIQSQVLWANEFCSPISRFGAKHLTSPVRIIATDGEIYIMEPKIHSVIVFSEAGEFIMNLSREGEGPGENKMLNIVALFDGTIYCCDWMDRSIHLFSQKDRKYLKSIAFTETLFGHPPYAMDFYTDGTMVMLNSGILAETPLIGLYTPDGKLRKRFFNALPAYNSLNAYMKDIKKNGHGNVEAQKNNGMIAVSGGKIYFANIIENQVIQLDMDGKVLARFAIPLPSHEKTLAFRIFSKGPEGIQYYMENQLNYDLKGRNNSIYILCRHEDISYIFRLEGETFREVCKMKETISKFDVMKDKIYCLRPEKDDDYEDNPEILVYKIPVN